MIRLVRIAVSFALVVGAYAAYSSLVVPAIEPPVETAANAGRPLEFTESDVSLRAKELAPLFPPDSWQVKNPMILDNNQSKLLFQKYTNQPNGEVELHPFTIVYDPGGPAAAPAERIRRCVVIDAPDGAILRFDKPLQLGRTDMGHLTGGRLLGRVTLRSDGRSPGPEDDLRVVTKDVQLSEREIWTAEAVDFRFGSSYGRGREMHIRLTPGDDSRSSDSLAPNVGGLESFELTHVIGRLHLEPNQAKTPPAQATARAPGAGSVSFSNGPMEISCNGPLQFDMSRQEATFRDHVDVWRIIPNSQSDLLTCELLTIHFAPKRENPANAASKETAKKKSSLADLEPQWVRAEGEPVVLDSKTQGVQASGQQLQYDLWTGGVVLESAAEAWMRQGSNEIHCSSLKYQPGPAGRLGQVLARGPGWFRGEKDPQPAGQFAAQPQQPDASKQPQLVEGRFQDQLLVRPQGPNEVVSLLGNAGLRFPQFGELTAREIHLWLIEQPQSGGAHSNKFAPDRMLALHDVRIHSPQLEGAVEHLETWFERPPRGAAPGDGQPPRRFQPATPLIAPPVASHWPYLRDPRIVLTAAYFPTAGSVPPTQRYQILGRLMRVRLILHEQQPADLAELMVEDGVRFQEIETAHPGERPMLITGDRVHALDVDPKSARGVVTVVGRPAHFEGDFDGRGLVTLDGPNINVDLGVNRLWVEGPGEMLLPLNRDPLEGRPLAQPGQLRVDWHKRMAFDGQVARFESDYPQRVNAISPKGRLLTAMLEVHLKQMIRFGESGMQRPGQGQADVSRIFCRGGADLDSATFEPKGQVEAQRLQTADLSIDMVSGALDAAGPGYLNRVAHGSADSTQMTAIPGATPRRPQPGAAADADALACLAVRFEGSLNGNIHTREATFHEQVRAARAPVDRWDALIDPDRPERLDPRRVLMRCDHLWVAELPTPVEGLRTPEVQAVGSAVVDAQTFTARALRISYVQAKDLLILEGDGWTDAELFRQLQIGGATNRTASRRIEYRPKTQELKFNDAHNMDFNAIPAGKAWK